MVAERLLKYLRYIVVVDDHDPAVSLVDITGTSLRAGATMIRYRSAAVSWRTLPALRAARDICRRHGVPFIISDDVILAQALEADGVHLYTADRPVHGLRTVLGDAAIIGHSVPDRVDLAAYRRGGFDYVELPPAAPAADLGTRADVPVVLQGRAEDGPLPACEELGAAGCALPASPVVLDALARAAERDGGVRCELESPWEGEFEVITSLLAAAEATPAADAGNVIIAAGDDACLLRHLSRPVMTTDTQREGIHFRLDWQTPAAIGQKAVAVTLSDLAASYAAPVGLFVNLTLPAWISEKTLRAVYRGIRTALGTYGGSLGGGNVSAGDRLALDLFAVGEGKSDLFPLRSAARVGEGVYSSGPLGLARAGLTALLKGDDAFPGLVESFRSPRARFDAAEVLHAAGVKCVTDISDGLIGDAGHIAAASGLTIELDVSGAHVPADLAAFCDTSGIPSAEMIMTGGEDYELLFTCPPETFAVIKANLPTAWQVGRCLPFAGTPLTNVPSGLSSFQHG